MNFKKLEIEYNKLGTKCQDLLKIIGKLEEEERIWKQKQNLKT